MESGSGQEAEPQASSSLASALLGGLVALGLLALGGLVLYRIYPSDLAEKKSPAFVDNIFANNLVVFAARLVLFSIALVLAVAAAYTIWSIVQWSRAGRLLTKAGPFEVGEEAIDALRAQVGFWREAAERRDDEVEALTERLTVNDRAIKTLIEFVSAEGPSATLREPPKNEEDEEA
jgi:hypothetical protein